MATIKTRVQAARPRRIARAATRSTVREPLSVQRWMLAAGIAAMLAALLAYSGL